MLVASWASFPDGEATAGDVLAVEAVGRVLTEAGLAHETAWSPVFRPGALGLDEVRPGRYSHLVFACGPVAGRPVARLHEMFARCRRIAVGVSVPDPADPAAAGFDVILARDGGEGPPQRDLAAQVRVRGMPVAGVVLVAGQPEYGPRGRHARVTAQLEDWLERLPAARVPLDTRLDPRGWRQHADPAQLESVIRRMDVVVTTRLHGLLLALKNGVPALAVDPVAGGAKVAAQASAWSWPVITTADGALASEDLDHAWNWCLSAQAAARAGRARDEAARAGSAPVAAPLTAALLRAL